jgi:cell division protein ZapD
MKGSSDWDSRMALQGLFDILALTGRNEFKGDLLKELDRHATTLNRLRQTPSVDAALLDNILCKISDVIGRIHGSDNLMQDAVRKTDFLCTAHKRSPVPGGSCQFDVPALYRWLQGKHSLRIQHLQGWLAPFGPLQEAVSLILELIRESATPQPEIAVDGFFQRALDCGAPYQLIRVLLPTDCTCFPEISAGKHRFTIHFMEQSDPNCRAVRSNADMPFELACCAI